MTDWLNLRNLYYVALLALVAAQLVMVPGSAQLQAFFARGAGTGMTIGTWLALGVGVGAVLAWLRRFG